ncbi:MAG: extensin family protein [Comamonadaceae bacterium]|nr:MAG: extensin family protein [Comamonadaceae bacterium]
MFKLIFWGLLLALGVAAYAVYDGRLQIPDRYNPWAPLRIAEPLNALTAFKLGRATGDPAMCVATLAESGMRFQPVGDRETGTGCGFSNAVRISGLDSSAGRNLAMQPFVLSCRAAVSLAMWEQHVLQPAAQANFRQSVTGIDHLGSYACRNIYHRDNASRSRHATADALDIGGVRLSGGKRVSVLRDWAPAGGERKAVDGVAGDSNDASAEARFLREIHQGACRFFDGVLGPEYNAAHRDHFHFDRGSFGVCR